MSPVDPDQVPCQPPHVALGKPLPSNPGSLPMAGERGGVYSPEGPGLHPPPLAVPPALCAACNLPCEAGPFSPACTAEGTARGG